MPSTRRSRCRRSTPRSASPSLRTTCSGSSMPSSREPLGILIVDDDDQMRKTIGDILALKGYASLAAPSGRLGLEVARSVPRPLAIALVDLRLPDMDGMELVSE